MAATAGLVALDLPGGPSFVAELRRIWDRGDAVLPVDQRLPIPARRQLFQALQPTSVVDVSGEQRLTGRPVQPGDALVMPTSGSTGVPKGVVHTHDGLNASAAATSERLGVGPGDHWLACLPLAHIGGFSVITKAWHAGTALTVLAGFEVDEVARAARSGANLVSLVATALRRIDPAWFDVIVLGGSRPPLDRPANCVATYGLTETGSGVVYDGAPLPGVELRIDDGEILVRGRMLCRGYRDDTSPVDGDGWLHTGDAGEFDAQGRLQVHGRRGDMIVTGGEKVWPDAVERILAMHPSVAEVAVVGVADPEWGQRVEAWVVPTTTSPPTPPPTLHELRTFAGDHLPVYMAPKALHLVAELPRTTLGKVQRHRIVQHSA